MKPIQHPSNNDVLGAPPGMAIDECRALAITRVMFNNGVPAIWSFWQPTDAERQAIATGAAIRLSILGSGMPPAQLGVDGVEEL